jgi:Ser/Thr protein kinase RdoA (MazF antagonist)
MRVHDERRNDRSSRSIDYPCGEHGEAIARLAQTLTDFMKRSTDDRSECQQRYERDRAESHEFRTEVRDRLQKIEENWAALQPDHKLLMYLAMATIMGGLSLIWRLLWTNIHFK